jgi:flavin reductase (DIM6/NTAB) family NADH-FMN oxidoreductase RutF
MDDATARHGVTRRLFLHDGLGAILAGGTALGCHASAPSPRAGYDAGGPRTALAEPGPMLPPVPAVLLTVKGREGEPDEISVVWSFVVNGDPPQVGISAGHEHRARELVGLRQEFVLNVPTSAIIDQFDTVDMNSSHAGDKFVLAGLNRGTAMTVAAPTVQECPIQLECRVFDTVEVPPVRTVFLADVVATTVLPGVVDASGRLVVDAVPFFGMTAGSGEFYTMGELVGHIGETVGRDDIKY